MNVQRLVCFYCVNRVGVLERLPESERMLEVNRVRAASKAVTYLGTCRIQTNHPYQEHITAETQQIDHLCGVPRPMAYIERQPQHE